MFAYKGLDVIPGICNSEVPLYTCNRKLSFAVYPPEKVESPAHATPIYCVELSSYHTATTGASCNVQSHVVFICGGLVVAFGVHSTT